MSGRPAVFLDRDGTMIHDAHYLRRLEDLRWYPWTIDAVRLLNRAGFVVCVTSNQGGVGLGLFPESFVAEVHGVMASTIADGGGRVDGWFYCPHHPNATIDALRVDCDCRKPKPGMLHQAASALDIDLSRSFAIGDRASDLGAAAAVGAGAVLVQTGKGEALAREHDGRVPGARYVAYNLMEATSWLLVQGGHPREAA